jgi:hypothetical protein
MHYAGKPIPGRLLTRGCPGFAAAAISLAHFTAIANDHHGTPVFDQVVGTLLAEKLDHARIKLAADQFQFAMRLLLTHCRTGRLTWDGY